MPRPSPLVRVLAVAIAALFVVAAPAAANTQQWSEPDESVTEFSGKELDLQSVTISQNATEALFEAEIQYTPTNPPLNDQVQIFVDTNGDGNADRAVGFVGLSSGQYTVEVREVTTTPANCQRLGTALYTSSPAPLPGPDGAGNRLLQAPFAASHLGASTYKWAGYVLNDSLTRAAFDYLPNEANPAPGRQNPVSDDMDGCDTDGDNDFDDPGADTVTDKAFPVDMTKGHQYGAPAGGGAGGGGTPPGGGGTGGGDELDVIPPDALVLPDAGQLASTFELPKMKPWKKKGKLLFTTRDELERSILKRARAACSCESPNLRIDATAIGLDHSRMSNTNRKALAKGGKPGSVVHAVIEPPESDNKVTIREGGSPVVIKFWHWDPSRDIKPKQEIIDDPDTRREKEIKARYKKLGCAPLAMGDRNEAAKMFLTREWFPPKRKRDDLKDGELSAISLLEREKCNFHVKFKKASFVEDPYVQDVELDQGKDWVIKFVVLLPQRSDYFLTLRDDAGRAKAGDLGLNAKDWTLPAAPGQSSIFTVSVNEIASGRFVQGASVDLYFSEKVRGGYGEQQKVNTVQTGPNGEVFFRNQIPVEGLLQVVARVQDANGEQAIGYRWIEVRKPSGTGYEVTSGRTLKKSGGKWKADQPAKFSPLEPASLGIDTRATGQPKVPNLGQGSIGKVVDHQGGRAVAIGSQNVLAAKGENIVVGMRPRLIVVGGGGPDVEKLGPYVTAAEMPAFMNALVTPLATAIDRRTGTIDRLIPPGSALHLDLKAQSARLLATPGIPPLSGLISDKGLGIISDNGGSLIGDHGTGIISEAGGVLINTSQGNLIGQAGGNLIGQAGGNLVQNLPAGTTFTLGQTQFIGTNTGGFISNSGGTLIGQAGGNFIPMGGGKIIGQDVGS